MSILMRSFLPSMFHRRLLLLLGIIGASMCILGAQLGRLTLAKGDSLRKEAEARLVRRQWIPASRGSILDRKGRVLAQDRPSYSIALPYRVITGDWAMDAARESARRAAGSRWLDLSPVEREERIAARRAVLQVHLDDAWSLLAEQTGVPREQIDSRRDRIISSVSSRFREIVDFRRVKEEDVFKQRGEAITPAIAAAIEKRISKPIAEQSALHVVISNISDEAGFACRVIASEEVEVFFHADGTDGPLDVMSPDDRRREKFDRIPGMEVIDTGEREYPHESMTVEIDLATLPGPLRANGKATITSDGLACHILGSVRNNVHGSGVDVRTGEFKPGDSAKRDAFLNQNPEEAAKARAADGTDRGKYFDGDRVGDTGIESSQENILRGLRGLQTRRLDIDEEFAVPPERGRDVRLTLDIALQARIQAVMSPQLGLTRVQPWHAMQRTDERGNPLAVPREGETLYGAAVVLDIDTGDILAMVSTPTFTREQVRNNPETVYADTAELRSSTPFINRAVAKPYQPGSIVKACVLVGAMARGNYRPDQRIECTGHLLPNQPNLYRCWIYKRFHTTHTAKFGHDPDGAEALMVSCNIFYFTLGRRLGPAGVFSVFRDFGVGEPFNLGIGMEYPGTLGSRGNGSDLTIGDAIQMGIGQGPIAWTPLHAADAFATIARDGVSIRPRIIDGRPRPAPRDIEIGSRAASIALDGLRRSVNDHEGTGHHITFEGGRTEPIFNVPGVRIWGKTGTAAAAPIRFDPDGKDGPARSEIIEEGDHSWFVVMVGRDRPRFVISVVSDFGGSGGKVSGPIANQIIWSLIVEGYL